LFSEISIVKQPQRNPKLPYQGDDSSKNGWIWLRNYPEIWKTVGGARPEEAKKKREANLREGITKKYPKRIRNGRSKKVGRKKSPLEWFVQSGQSGGCSFPKASKRRGWNNTKARNNIHPANTQCSLRPNIVRMLS